MGKKYKALRLISDLYIFSGWFCIIIGILAIFFLLLSGNKDFTLKESIIITASCIIVGLFSIGSGELIILFIDIEHNTRQSKHFEKKVEVVTKTTDSQEETPTSDMKDVYLLNQLIVSQKKKYFAARTDLIPELLRKIVTNIDAGKSLASKYETQFDKELINDLISLSSSHDAIHFYVNQALTALYKPINNEK